MADRILSWIIKGDGETVLPAYFLEAEYAPLAVRIRAETAPSTSDATFDIFDDGVSIFANHKARPVYYRFASDSTDYSDNTKIILPQYDSVEEDAEYFKPNLVIAQGSWITCQIYHSGSGRNFSVHLELEKLSENDVAEVLD